MDGQITQGQAACMKKRDEAAIEGLLALRRQETPLEGATATWLLNFMRNIQ